MNLLNSSLQTIKKKKNISKINITHQNAVKNHNLTHQMPLKSQYHMLTRYSPKNGNQFIVSLTRFVSELKKKSLKVKKKNNLSLYEIVCVYKEI